MFNCARANITVTTITHAFMEIKKKKFHTAYMHIHYFPYACIPEMYHCIVLFPNMHVGIGIVQYILFFPHMHVNV